MKCSEKENLEHLEEGELLTQPKFELNFYWKKNSFLFFLREMPHFENFQQNCF